jgi:hypothetical protein
VNGAGAEDIAKLADRSVDGAVSDDRQVGDDAKCSGNVIRDQSRQSHHSFLRTGPTQSGAKEAGSGLLSESYQKMARFTLAGIVSATRFHRHGRRPIEFPTRSDGASSNPISPLAVGTVTCELLRLFRRYPLVEVGRVQ